jgi:poly-gamma-glutamate synthase PgsB/CapB
MWNDVALMAALAGMVTAALHVEWRRHRRDLARIPTRIHVNGTRGKSSVTRLIAAVLREQGVRTVAKTTGTSPRLILPDGGEENLARNGLPNIGELTKALHRAAEMEVDAIVFECMAVNPELQRVAEDRIVQPTITVITNARLDHTEVQGASRELIAAGFPVRSGGVLVTADPLVAHVLGPGVSSAGGTVRLSTSLDSLGRRRRRVTLPYLEHPDNVFIALEVADVLGIPRRTALRGMRRCRPDPGRASIVELNHWGGNWQLVNLFAANDPDSTFRALDELRPRLPGRGRPVVLFASRSDRAARSADFAAVLADNQEQFARVFIWGEGTRALARVARARGVASDVLVDAGSMNPESLTRMLVDSLDGQRVVVGIGNIVGHAQDWLEHIAPYVERTIA